MLGAGRMREAAPPQTTFYPCRSLPPAHLLLQALVAPVKPWGGQPLLKIGSRRAPCLLPRCPYQPSCAAPMLSEFLEMDGGFESRAVRQEPRLDKPPQGNEQLARQRDHP